VLAAAAPRYRPADAGIARLPRDCRPAIASARAIYSAIGDQIARAGHDSVSRRAYTGRARKLRLMAGALARAWAPAWAQAGGPGGPAGAESEFLLAAVGA
jgi:phytoene synthase